MIDKGQQKDVYLGIRKHGSGVIRRITKNHHDSEDREVDCFLKITGLVRDGKLEMSKALSPAFLKKVSKNAALDKVRGPRRDKDAFERGFDQAINDGWVEDSDQGRATFTAWYEKYRSRPSPKRCKSLPVETAATSELGLAIQIFGEALFDCIHDEDPNSILLRKHRDGMTWEEIASFEQHRKLQDEIRGELDPGGYGETVPMARGKLDRESKLWRHHRWDVILRAVRPKLRELAGSGALMEFHAMYETLSGDDGSDD